MASVLWLPAWPTQKEDGLFRHDTVSTKPRLPIQYYQAQGLADCQARPATKPGMAAVQLLNTKVYIAWSPSVIQTCMRSRYMSVDNGMAIGLAMRLFGMYVSEEQINAHASTEDMEVPDGDYAPNADDHALDAFLNGPPLFEMNVRVLNTISGILNSVSSDVGLQIPNL